MNLKQYFTLPNLLSYLRGIGAPVFLYVYLALDNELLAFMILIVGGVTDYLDGKVARMLNLTSDFGAKLDPSIDRLYIFSVLIALLSKDLIPQWMFVTLIARDLLVFLVVIYQKLKQRPLIEVTYLGKSATFNLLYAFPFLLISSTTFENNYWLTHLPYILGWSFGIWGIALYLLTGVEYIAKGVRMTK